jgi:formamidopyrimidine-DNA glycosylase
MPELPEVETVRRGLQPVMEGARILKVETRRPDLRFPLPPGFSETLKGRRITALGRRAKYLTMHMEGGPVLICHLGMSGSFRIESDENPPATPGVFHHERSKLEAHDHVVFTVKNGKARPSRVIFNDPRRFGFMLLGDEASLDSHPMLAGLGTEPTGNALSGALISELFRGRSAPLKAALLDQRLIAGIGNIYACEALWRAKLSPRRAAGTIAGRPGKSTQRADRLADALRAVIAAAIEAGGSSLRDHIQTDGSLGSFQHRFKVYDREGDPCLRRDCNGVVSRIVQSGRSTFYCPVCQR